MKVNHIVAYSCISLIASHGVNKPQFLCSSVGGLEGDEKKKDRGERMRGTERTTKWEDQQGGENEERKRWRSERDSEPEEETEVIKMNRTQTEIDWEIKKREKEKKEN